MTARNGFDLIAELLLKAHASPWQTATVSPQTFGRWRVVAGPVLASNSVDGGGKRSAHWWVTCECGAVSRLVRAARLKSGASRGCGCERNEKASVLRTKHGGRATPEYAAWSGMIHRCENPNFRQYADWGGRGIRVCARWRSSFADFLADVGPRPSPKHSIDRIDVNGNYEPGNVRWATAVEQNSNRRNSMRKSA